MNNEQFQKLKQRTANAKTEGLVMGMDIETMESLIALVDATLCTECSGRGIVWQGGDIGACDWCGGMGKSGACGACELAERATEAATPAPKTPEIEGIGQAPAAAAPTIDTPKLRNLLGDLWHAGSENNADTDPLEAAIIAHLEEIKAAARKEGEEANLSLHRRLAAETLRADQGWQRYESANADRNDLRARLASAGAGSELTDEQIEETFKKHGGRWDIEGYWVIEDADLHPLFRAVLARTTNEGKHNG